MKSVSNHIENTSFEIIYLKSLNYPFVRFLWQTKLKSGTDTERSSLLKVHTDFIPYIRLNINNIFTKQTTYKACTSQSQSHYDLIASLYLNFVRKRD